MCKKIECCFPGYGFFNRENLNYTKMILRGILVEIITKSHYLLNYLISIQEHIYSILSF